MKQASEAIRFELAERLKELEADLVAARGGEGFISGEQVVLKSFTKLFLDDVGPDLVIEGLHHLILCELGEVLDVTELTVEDEGLALGEGLNKVGVGGTGLVLDISEGGEMPTLPVVLTAEGRGVPPKQPLTEAR